MFVIIYYDVQHSCITKMNKQDADKFKDKVEEFIRGYVLESGPEEEGLKLLMAFIIIAVCFQLIKEIC